MVKFQVLFYEKENGECPVEEFLSGSKPLEDGIFEIRCGLGNRIIRVMYFFYYEGKIILTNGFTKKTQKTPRLEIDLAKQRRSDFIRRMGEL